MEAMKSETRNVINNG